MIYKSNQHYVVIPLFNSLVALGFRIKYISISQPLSSSPVSNKVAQILGWYHLVGIIGLESLVRIIGCDSLVGIICWNWVVQVYANG